MARITMSKLPRLAICPASAALPGVDVSNPWSSAGTITHRFLERCAQVGPATALGEAPEEHRARLACIELDALPLSKEHRQEVTYAYDVATGKARRLGEGLGRNYSAAADTEIVGTADVDGPAVVCDYKTDHGHDELAPPPRQNLQLRALALAKARVENLDEVTVEIIRVRDDGSSRFEPATLDFFDLEDTAAELARIHRKVGEAAEQVKRGEVPSVRESEHCRYCPAAHVCPARTALLRQAAWTPDDVRQEVFSALTPAQESLAYETWRRIGKLYGDLTGQLKKYAAERGGLVVAPGKAWGPVEKERESINGRVAFEVLRERYGEGVAGAAVEIKATKSALEEALREVKAKTGIPLAQLKREALKEIGEAGGITVETKPEFELYEKASNE